MQGPLLRSELIRVEVQFLEIITPHASSMNYPGSHGSEIYQKALVKNSSEEEEARSVDWLGGWRGGCSPTCLRLKAGRRRTQTPWPRQVKHISLQAKRLCFTNYCFKLQVLLTGCQGFYYLWGGMNDSHVKWFLSAVDYEAVL